jgi:hypothetical protein
VTSKIINLTLLLSQRAAPRRLGTPLACLSAAIGLLCTGCTAGSALDTPPQQYIQPASATTGTGTGGMTGVATTGAVATTGGPPACTDAQVNELFLANCSTSSCHGNPGADPNVTSGLYLFDPAIRTSFVGRPGATCTTELLIDQANPRASLLVTVLKQVAQCGVAMPSTFLKLDDADIACVESWVNDVVATGQ